MPGPAPMPAKLKLLSGRGHGTDSGGRKVAEGPAFERAAPTPPAWLPEHALAEWQRVVPELDRLGILKRLDRAALVAYCLAWQRLVDATEEIKRRGMTYTDDKGKVFRRPAVVSAEAASKELRAWAGEFGLTPSAEQRLAGSSDGKDDKGNPFAASG